MWQNQILSRNHGQMFLFLGSPTTEWINDLFCCFMRMSVKSPSRKWIMDKFCCFMRMSVICDKMLLFLGSPTTEWISYRITTSLWFTYISRCLLRMRVRCYGLKWISVKIPTSLGIMDKFRHFMRMSVQCKSFKWINDKITSSRNNSIGSWEWVSEVKLKCSNNVNYCKNSNIFRNSSWIPSLHENDWRM